MHLITFNFTWMTVNILLAVLPILFGWIFYSVKNKLLKYFFAAVWLVFLPNSIYLFTDLINLMKQWPQVDIPVRFVFIFQYSVLIFVGYITTILSMYPFELYLKSVGNLKKGLTVKRVIIILNFIIGFGITLGRVERINSWEVVSDPLNVVKAAYNIISSPSLIALTILFGLFANLFYFAARDGVIRYFNTYLGQADS